MASEVPRSRRARVRALPVLLLLALVLGAPAASAQSEEVGLRQRIDPGQQVASGRKLLDRGHVDVGPRYVGGRWTLMIHDDAAKAEAGGESVWRHVDRTVLRVTDDAVLQIPDDRNYSFIPASPGTKVHVVPQTQNPDVVWLGWNTQDPTIMEEIDRGVTMTMTDIQGPGDLLVYLQSGDFAAPKVLWNSTKKPQPIFVDVDTHTHANWVFTKPGTYLVQIRVSAELIDGRKVSDTRQLRFAVGSRTPTSDAFAAAWKGRPARAEPSADDARPAPSAENDGSDDDAVALIIAIILLAVALGVGLMLLVLRGNRAKRRAREIPSPDESQGDEHEREGPA